jgi:AsmA family protein
MENDAPNPQRSRWSALRAWGARARDRAREGAGWTWRKVSSAPWKRIGIWAGGVFGVLVVALVAFVTFADWNALKGPISRMASAATGREIVIAGDLDVDPWSWTPEIRVSGLRIGNTPRYHERGTFAEVEEADAAVRLLPLFIGRFDFVRIDLRGADVNLYRSAEGISNWSPERVGRGRPFNLPAIREFSLSDGRVTLEDDKRRMVLNATFTTRESADPRNPGRFELIGEGQINRRPFTIELTGAPLLNVRRDRPYPFVADVQAGGTHIEANGSIARPFDFGVWQARVAASGPDLADLYPLIGLALPNTPPYNLRGVVRREGRVYGMPRVTGRVGDSDLTGAFTASRRTNDRLFLEGDFRTNSLDFDDLMAVLGGAPDTDETASPEQRALAANLEAQGRLLPDAQLDISRVRNMDAQVSYRAARVRSDRFPLRGMSVDINLDNGLLRLDPMTLQLSQGRIGGAVAINARESVPRVDLDVRLSNARLESIFRVSSGNHPMTGALYGRAQLSGRGGSVRDAAANASGTVSLVVPSGEIREAFAELTGINVVRGLGLLLSDDESKIDIRCGVASFQVENGIARTRTMVVDTETMLITGEGAVSLRDETLDLRIEGDPKEARLISISAPITLEGRLRSPDVGIEAGEAAGQGGLAAALASLVAPIAAVLPFIDAGLAEDTNCAALLASRNGPPREG